MCNIHKETVEFFNAFLLALWALIRWTYGKRLALAFCLAGHLWVYAQSSYFIKASMPEQAAANDALIPEVAQ